jgi:uncharacterized membrane protein
LSLESGRKLGLTASVIAIVIPLIVAVAYVGFFIALLGSFSSPITRASPGTALLPLTILGALVIAGVVGFVGYVLFMVAMHNLSKYYAELAIFRNLLNALIIGIVGSVILGVVIVALVAASAGSRVPAGAYQSAPLIWGFVGLGVFFLGILAIAIYCAVLTRRAFDKLSDKSGVDSFRTAGLLFLIGSFIPLVSFVGWIFAAIGYNKLAPNQPPIIFPQYPSQVGITKRCPNCGVESSYGAIYCRNCGRTL